jgi:hypothetical protein
MHGGDLVSARAHLDDAIRSRRDANDLLNLSINLGNLTNCLGWLGEVESARRAAEEATTYALAAGDLSQMWITAGIQGWVSMLAGDIHVAERLFITADRTVFADEAEDLHLYGFAGTLWGEFLARTDRLGPARTLTERNRDISADHGWNQDVARCDRLLGRLHLAGGDTTTARQRLTAAAATFRDGDYLVELALTLSVLADCARAGGDLPAASWHAEEALTIAAPRGLRPSQAAALTVRARTEADRVAAGSRDHLARGRDAVEAAHRIATRHRLAWPELDALDAHARLDQVEGVDHGWSRQATVLRARLIPAGLDPDPLASVERLVAEENARRGGDYAK